MVRPAPKTLTAISSLSSPAAKEFNKVSKSAGGTDSGTAAGEYRVASTARKTGETTSDFYVRELKAAMHRDYPITGDDGGYSLSALSSKASPDAIRSALSDAGFDPDDATPQALQGAIEGALKGGLEVVTGQGSGNNTYANIVGVIDPKSKEVGYFISSNFGSDD